MIRWLFLQYAALHKKQSDAAAQMYLYALGISHTPRQCAKQLSMLGAENCPQILKFTQNTVEIRYLEGTTTKPI